LEFNKNININNKKNLNQLKEANLSSKSNLLNEVDNRIEQMKIKNIKISVFLNSLISK